MILRRKPDAHRRRQQHLVIQEGPGQGKRRQGGDGAVRLPIHGRKNNALDEQDSSRDIKRNEGAGAKYE